MARQKCTWGLLFCLLAVIPSTVMAEPVTVTIRDYIGVEWRDELVHYPLHFDVGELTGKACARVRIDGRQAIPCQISDVSRYDDGSIRSYNVWFFASVPANEAVSYLIEPGEAGPTGSVVSIKKTAEQIELMTLAPKPIGIRLLGGSREYPYPVPAADAPSPIQALLLPSGRSTGEGRFEVPFFVKSYNAEVPARGPLFAEVRVRYTFDTGYWTFKAKVLSGCPMVIIEEELDTGYADQTWDQFDRFYSFKINGNGFRPKQAFYTGRTDENGYHDLLNQEIQGQMKRDKTGTSHTEHSCGTAVNGYTLRFPVEMDRCDYYLTSWPTWSPRCGIAVRFVEPGKDAVGFATLTTSKWRNPLSLRFRANAKGELLACLPMQVYEQDWVSEGFGRYSPNATGKTLFVPENTARRHYGIMLSSAENEIENKMDSLIRLAVKLGSHPLDIVKGWTLDWPDPMAKQTWAKEPTEKGTTAVQRVRDWVELKRTLGHFGLYSMWNHRSMTHVRFPLLNPVVDSPESITAEQRRELRRLCAYQAYVLNSPEHFPWGVGCHLGNPNMSIMAVNARVKSSLLVKDHPMFKVWGAWTREFVKDYIRRYTRESGAPYENVHYTLGVTFREIAESNKVFLENGLGDALDTDLFSRSMRFTLDWITPPELRWNGHRVYLPIGNGAGYPSMPPDFGELIIDYFKGRDPELAGQLQWATNQTLPADKQVHLVKEVVPKLSSVHHKDYGVFFRHGFGTPHETLFCIMAGTCDGHNELETDQMAYTLYAKGHPIHLTFGNGYHPMFVRPWLRNRVSFDHKFEVTERNSTQVATACFMPDAEYMRATRDVDQIRPLQTEHPLLTETGMQWSDEERKSWPTPPTDIETIPTIRWHRQVLFVKDADPKGPNYFVLRDAFGGMPTRPTDLNLWFLANSMQRRGSLFHFDGQVKVDMDVFVNTPTEFEPITDKYGHPAQPYGRLTGWDEKYFPEGKRREGQLLLRIEQPVGKGYLVVLYPRLKKTDPPATFHRLGDNAVRIETTLSTDHALLAPFEFTFEDERVQFKGQAATVRFFKSGRIVVANCEGKIEAGVAGKRITGEGAFVVSIEGNKATIVKHDEVATAHVN